MSTVTLEGVRVIDAGRTRLASTSLAIEAGTITALGGPNGAGKSTLLSLIAGELAPSAGIVRLLGRDPRAQAPTELARSRAVLDQDTPTPAGFTVAEVVAWGRRCWRGTEHARRDDEVVGRMLEEHGIAHLAERPAHALSGGERRRVHLARVRAQEAAALLLDEADADLDLEGRYHLDEAMRREAARGAAVVIVSHDLRRLARTAERMVLLREGVVTADGPPDIVAAPDRLATLFGIPPEAV